MTLMPSRDENVLPGRVVSGPSPRRIELMGLRADSRPSRSHPGTGRFDSFPDNSARRMNRASGNARTSALRDFKGTVPDVIGGHRPGSPYLERQARLGAVER